ncbi:MAG: Ig domain-containing protein [Nitrospira sp.]
MVERCGERERLFRCSVIATARWLLIALVVAVVGGCSSSPQDGSVVSGTTKNNHAPIVRLVTIVPNPLILAGPITAHVMADDPDGTEPTKRFQWIVNGAPVLGATGAELDPLHAKRGDQVSLEVVAMDGELESAPYRTEPVAVVNTPPLVSHVTVEADAEKSNRVLARVDAVDPDRDEIHYSYRWWRNEKQVKEGEDSVLDTTGFGRKDVVVVEVTARDQDAVTAPVRSAPSALGNSPPLIVSNPAALTNREQYEYVVQAKDVDGDMVTYGLETGPPGMTIDSSTGQVNWKVIPGVAGTHRVKITAEDGQGGIAWQEFELSIPSTAQSQASLPPQG